MNPEGQDKILDVELAHEQALKMNTGYDEAHELGIGHRASETVLAHDRRYTVAEALAECPEFGQSIRNVVESMTEAGVPEDMRKDVVDKAIDKKVNEAAAAPIPQEVQERTATEQAANKAVKKN